MQNTLEHINVTVRDAHQAAEILGQIFDWKIRWAGPAKDNGIAVHLGTDSTYIALYSNDDKHVAETSSKTITQLNHIGVLVDNLEDVELKVKALGFTACNYGDYEPGKRFYFNLDDGLEIEAVSYKDR